MDLELCEQERRFIQEVRTFIAEKFSPALRAEAAKSTGMFGHLDSVRSWHRILFEKGWVAPYWPREYGGPGWSVVQGHIFATECATAGTPVLPAMGIIMCGPVVMRYGTPQQKAYFLPRILSGEHYWCQGYSEPQAGSDLSSLKTRAVRDGEDYIINGSKIWTTHAHCANWIFLLARTSIEERQQQGISFVVAPLNTPGITIAPIMSMSGEHEVNQVFFDDVRVPRTHCIGPEGAGWEVAKYLLEFERGGISIAGLLHASLERTARIAGSEQAGNGRSLAEDPAFRRKSALGSIEVMLADWTERRLTYGQGTGASVGQFAASIKKLYASETIQKLTELQMEALGVYAVPDQRKAIHPGQEPPIGPEYAVTPTARFLNARARTIFGGSSEIQRNILAKGLGL
jgi:alkylation response protein AidB-like acyl-CoA dehydrogenase